MKKQALTIGFLFAAVALKAQDGVIHMQVTDAMRIKFAMEAKAPDPSQIVYSTSPELLKRVNPVLLQPTPEQIVTEIPPTQLKKVLPLQPAALPPDQLIAPAKE